MILLNGERCRLRGMSHRKEEPTLEARRRWPMRLWGRWRRLESALLRALAAWPT